MTQVEMQLTVQGTVEDFDQPMFQASLGAYLTVSPTDISLVVSAASVNVKVTITFTDASAAGSVVDTLQGLVSNLTALSAAVGVTVEGATDPVVSHVVVIAPSPPPRPSSPPPSPPACTDKAGEVCKNKKCEKYKPKKKRNCKKTCDLCEPLPPPPPPPTLRPPRPPPPPETDCAGLADKKKCKIAKIVQKCKAKPPKSMKKCKKHCNGDAKKKPPRCEKTCCELGF